jgi:hypothetical protein
MACGVASRFGQGSSEFVNAAHIHRHAFALIAIERLHDNRVTELLPCGNCFLERGDGGTARDRQQRPLQDLLGQALVLVDLEGDVAGGSSNRRLNQAPAAAESELREATSSLATCSMTWPK